MTSNREPARLSLMLALGVVTLAAPAVSAQEPQEEQAPPEQRVEQTITVTATRRPFDLEEISAHASVRRSGSTRHFAGRRSSACCAAAQGELPIPRRRVSTYAVFLPAARAAPSSCSTGCH